MAITLTTEEQEFLNENRAAGWTIDEDVEIPAEDSETHGVFTYRLGNGNGARFIKYVHEFTPDTITIFECWDPPVELTAQEKLVAFLNENTDVKELLGM